MHAEPRPFFSRKTLGTLTELTLDGNVLHTRASPSDHVTRRRNYVRYLSFVTICVRLSLEMKDRAVMIS